MKKIGVRKLAAIAAGAALLGTAIAPFAIAAASDLSKTDVYDATSGSPIVNIVVGSTAKASDIIWAGNIAAKIAEKATTTKTITKTVSSGTADTSAATVELEVGGGATTYANAWTLEGYLRSASQEPEFDKNDASGTSLTNSQLPDLYNTTDTYTWNSISYTTSIRDKIDVTLNPKFNPATGVQALVAELGTNAFAYVLDLGSGIPVTESSTDSTHFTDGTNDSILVPFFGKKYLVREVDVNTSGSEYAKLVESNAKKTLLPGESVKVAGKNAYADKELDLVVEILTTGGNAKFVLKDGDTVLQTVTQGTGAIRFLGDDGKDLMATAVTVDTISVTGSNTSTGVTVGYVDMFVGAAGLDLYSAKGYPYDPSDATGIYNWKVTLTTTTGLTGRLTKVRIYNSNKRWQDTSALKADSIAEFITGGYKIKFIGWKADKAFTTIKIGANKLVFKDNTSVSHSYEFSLDNADGLTGLPASDDATGSFSIDGKTVYYLVNQTDADSNFLIPDSNLNTALGVAGTPGYTYVNGRRWTIDVNQGTNAACWIKIGDNAGFGGGGNITAFTGVLGGSTRFTDINLTIGGTITVDKTLFTLTGISQTGCTFGASGYVVFKSSAITTTGGTASEYLFGYPQGDTNFASEQTRGITGSPTFGRYYYTAADEMDANMQAVDLSFYKNLTTTDTTAARVTYALRVNEGTPASYPNRMFLLMDDQNFATEFSGNQKSIRFEGTQTQGTESFGFGAELDANHHYYIPDVPAVGGQVGDTTYYIAKFTIDEGGNAVSAADGLPDVNVFIQTDTGKLLTLPNTNLSNYSYQMDYNNTLLEPQGAVSLNLRNDTTSTSYYSKAYADSGTYIEAGTDGIAVIKVPEQRPYVQAVVQSSGTTETIAEGETGTGKIGSVVEIGSSKVKVKSISGITVSGADTNAPVTETVTVAAGLGGKGKVVQDSADPGAAILIGGQKVNRLTRALTEVTAKLAKAGDYVVEKSGNKIVVAGYTASDTGTAAQQLIACLDKDFSNC